MFLLLKDFINRFFPIFSSNFFNDEGNNKHRLTTIFDTFDNNFNFSELMKREDIQRKSKEIS